MAALHQYPRSQHPRNPRLIRHFYAPLPPVKAHRLFTLAVCLAFVPLHAEDKAPPAPPAPKPTKVHVTVIAQDAAKQPLGGVAIRGVELWTRGPNDPFHPVFEGATDDQGRWTGDIPFGEYTVLATRGPLTAGDKENNYQTYWSLNSRTLQREIPMTLREGGDLNVRVIDAATNAPLPKTQLVLDDGHVAETDDHGQAKLRGVAMGEHALVGMKPPYSDRRADFNNTGQSYMEVQIAMTPGFKVRGQVRDSTGKPVVNAVVRDHYSGRAIHCDHHHCITDAEGRYELGWYSKAKPLWSFGVEHKDFANQNKSELPPPTEGDVVVWDFVLDQGYTIAGVVHDESGQPLKGAEVRYGGAAAWVDSRTVRSGADGQFRIAHISKPTPELVIAHAKGFAPAFFHATPGKDKEVPQLDFKLEKGLVVKGRVVDREGKPIAGASFSPMWEMDGRTEYAVERRFGSDKDGNFKLEDIPTKGNFLDIYGRGFSDIRRMPFDPQQPLLITVDRPGAIVGKVLDDETGQPIANFNVRLGFPKSPRAKDEPSASYSSHLSDRGQDCRAQDGSFVIEELITRAPHAVYVTAEGYLIASEDRVVAMPTNDKGWPQVFRLKRGHPIKGQVTDASTGKPIANAQILITPDTSRAGLSLEWLNDWRGLDSFATGFEKRSDGQGHFALSVEDLEKPFFCYVHATGYAPFIATPSASSLGATWQIKLEAGAMLKGSLHGVVDKVDDRISVDVYTPTYSTGRISLSPDGSFNAKELPPGPVLVTVSRSDGRIYQPVTRAVVTLKAGENPTLDFAKTPPASLRCTVIRDGQPVPNTPVMVKWPAQSINSSAPVLGMENTDEKGVVLFRNLPRIPLKVQLLSGVILKSDGAGVSPKPDHIVDLSNGGEQSTTLEAPPQPKPN